MVISACFSERQARELLDNDPGARSGHSGDILNNHGPMEYNQSTGVLSINFKNMVRCQFCCLKPVLLFHCSKLNLEVVYIKQMIYTWECFLLYQVRICTWYLILVFGCCCWHDTTTLHLVVFLFLQRLKSIKRADKKGGGNAEVSILWYVIDLLKSFRMIDLCGW